MSKEVLIEKLQTVYVGDINALNEMIGYYDGLKQGIEELQQENQQLKEQLEASEKARLKCLNKIKTLGKFDGEKCTRSFTLWSADFNELAKILDIDKGE